MDALLTSVGKVVTAVLGNVGALADLVVDKPVFAIGLTGMFIGLGLKVVKVFKRY